MTAQLFDTYLLFIECLKLLAPDLKETWTLVRTHQRPVLILFHATHKQIRNPQPKEQVSGTVFLSTGVLATIQVLENVSMPRLQVYRKSSGTLKTVQTRYQRQNYIIRLLIGVIMTSFYTKITHNIISPTHHLKNQSIIGNSLACSNNSSSSRYAYTRCITRQIAIEALHFRQTNVSVYENCPTDLS